MKHNTHYLTDRMLEVALLACQGYSTKEMALQLNRTYDTVKTQLVTIMERLGTHDRCGIPRKLVELGYLEVENLPKPIDRRAGGKYNAISALCSGQETPL